MNDITITNFKRNHGCDEAATESWLKAIYANAIPR